MTAPPRERRSPAVSDRATSTPPSATSESNCRTDIEADLKLVGNDGELWSRLFNGEFRLAVRCDICGRWLTDGRSKRAHRGPRCASKAVSE